MGLAGRQDRVSGNVLKHKSQKMLDANFAAVQKLHKIHMHVLKRWLFPPPECSPAHSTHNYTVTQLLFQSLVNLQDTACPPECFSLSTCWVLRKRDLHRSHLPHRRHAELSEQHGLRIKGNALTHMTVRIMTNWSKLSNWPFSRHS